MNIFISVFILFIAHYYITMHIKYLYYFDDFYR